MNKMNLRIIIDLHWFYNNKTDLKLGIFKYKKGWTTIEKILPWVLCIWRHSGKSPISGINLCFLKYIFALAKEKLFSWNYNGHFDRHSVISKLAFGRNIQSNAIPRANNCQLFMELSSGAQFFFHLKAATSAIQCLLPPQQDLD